MPVDANHEFRKLRMGILKDVMYRRQGAFSRAMWYGGQSAPAKAFAAAKDVGKDVRVGNVAGFALGAAASAIPVVPGLLAVAVVAKFVEAAAEKAVEAGGDAGRDFYQSWRHKTGGTIELDSDEKNVKDILSVIERNITKLTDARRRAKSAIDKLNQGVSQPANRMDLESLARCAEDALRAVYEVGHYHAKLTNLTEKLAAAVDKLRKDLARLDDPLTDHIDAVERTAEAVLKACLASGR
jgi:hypothetical protein